MSIVLNEHEWAEKMINEKSLGKKPSETMRRVARYYLDQGYSDNDVRDKLDAFLLQCDPRASLPKWSNSLDYALKKAKKFPAIDVEKVTVSKTELNVIMSLESTQLQRLAFTLLCLSKFWKAINPDLNYWINNKDNEIMAMANVKTSVKRQGYLYHDLYKAGLIQFSKQVDNTNVRVCFADEETPELEISDFRNLGYQYLMYNDGPYFNCECCGATTKITGVKNKRKQRYCAECAIKIKTKKSVESVMRQRGRKSSV